MLGFKSEDAGRSRAKAGVMRRLSMVALRSTARHVLWGLAIVGPPCIHQLESVGVSLCLQLCLWIYEPSQDQI